MKPTILHVKNLEDAILEIRKVNSHPVGVQIMALKAVHRLVKFEGVEPRTANIVKQEILSRGGDAALSATVGMFENVKTDLIIMGTLAQYIRLIRKLMKQSSGDCVRIGQDLQNLLFKDFDIEAANVL